MEKLQRVIIVTGSSSGIGATLCRQLAAPGTGLVVHARHNRQGAEAVAHELQAKGARTLVVLGDLADPDFPAQLVNQTVAEFGKLDALIANAGIPILKTLKDGSRHDLEYATATNLSSLIGLVQSALSHLRDAPQPRIIALSSFTAHLFRNDMPLFPFSSPSKAGLEVLVKSLAQELGPDGITVNCVAPGFILKDPGTKDGLPNDELAEIARKIPLRRPGKAEDVTPLIRFLMSSEASYITGQTLHVNGGLV